MEYTILLPNKTMQQEMAAAVKCIALDGTADNDYEQLEMSYIFISLCDVDKESLDYLLTRGYKEIRILKKCSQKEYPSIDTVVYFDIKDFYDFVPTGGSFLHFYIMEILLCHQFRCCYKSQNTSITSETLAQLEAGSAFNGVLHDDLFAKIFGSWDGLRLAEQYVADGKLLMRYELGRMSHGKVIKLQGGVYKLIPGGLPQFQSEYTNCIGYSIESPTHMNFEFYTITFNCVKDSFDGYSQRESNGVTYVIVPMDHLSGIFNFEIEDIVYKGDGLVV